MILAITARLCTTDCEWLLSSNINAEDNSCCNLFWGADQLKSAWVGLSKACLGTLGRQVDRSISLATYPDPGLAQRQGLEFHLYLQAVLIATYLIQQFIPLLSFSDY